ncbi:MAG: pantoate--beta-alanine ligase [Acidothermaceae bacterium]
MMHVATTREELAEARSSLQGTVSFVPTMGALHAGHRSLLVRGRDLADHVAVSVFVNPLQFAPNEDLERYPRTREADLAMCAEEGVALVFMPSREVMYPTEPVVRVSAGPIGERFEGASRPGHFDGVLTAVAKLFGLLQPDVAVFSRKDAQQLALLKRMVADLDLGVRIDAAPFVRDADGLALSSRNRYLSSAQRVSALGLPSALAAAALEAEKGAPSQHIVNTARVVLESTDGIEVDYVALVDPDEFTEIGITAGIGSAGSAGSAGALLIAAAWVGATRLIDNLAIAPRSGDGIDSSAPTAVKG